MKVAHCFKANFSLFYASHTYKLSNHRRVNQMLRKLNDKGQILVRSYVCRNALPTFIRPNMAWHHCRNKDNHLNTKLETLNMILYKRSTIMLSTP